MGYWNNNMKENNVLVSIVIPVYNGADYISESIKSALSQTYSNIEVVVVNDGSTDLGETEKKVLSFSDDRIKYYRKENGGVASALNYGIARAKGEYIVWLSHDDIIPPNKISSQLKQLVSLPSNVILYSKSIIIDENGKKANFLKQIMFSIKKTGFKEPYQYFSIKHLIYSSLLVPRKFFESNPFILELKYSQDYFSFFQMLSSGYDLKYCPGGYSFYRVHSSQGSFTRINDYYNDIKLIFNYYTIYFEKTGDKKFINRYFNACVKKAGTYEPYREIVNEMIKRKDFYKLNATRVKCSSFSIWFYKKLLSAKKKIFGR